MAGTRSSARQAETSSPQATPEKGTKRKQPPTPSSSKKAKEQRTIEQTIDPSQDKDAANEDLVDDDVKDEDIKEAEASTTATHGDRDSIPSGARDDAKEKENAFDQVKADQDEEGKTSKVAEQESDDNGTTEGTAVEEDKQREKAQPSNIMEKGIIYFFTRGRVGVEDPNNVSDLQRSFFVLRPLPAGAKLCDGAIQDVGNNRLIAVPKKVWPKSGRDQFMAFVEKAKTDMTELKETFFQGSDYSTKTAGTRHTPEVTPLGEGVYAIISTGEGRTTTHLAYQLTIPQEVGAVQRDVGLNDKGAFILSIKNPESAAPSYALPNSAEFSKDIIDEFAGRAWLPARPEHLNYDGCSFLLIGESFDDAKDKALEPKAEDEKKDEKEVPKEELEKLEAEDWHRIGRFRGDDTIFEDLGISSKDYPKVPTTW